MPRISVVMPLYNREDSVARAIDSVLGQDFHDFEIIVVDDHSSDEGPRRVEAIADERIQLIRLPANGGGNAARNRGIEAATAPIVAFLDSDDEYLPGRLTHVMRTFDQRPGLGGLLDGYRRPARRAGRPDHLHPNALLEDRDLILRDLFLRRIHKATSGIAVRRSVAIQAGLFDETLKRRQDYDFLIRIIRAAPFTVTGQANWIKHRGLDAISDDHAAFLPALYAFWDRHPEYYDDRRLRRGFNLDLARHVWRAAKDGRWDVIRKDSISIARRLGPAAAAASLTAGLVEFLKWRRAESLSARRTASAETAAAARTGESTRSTSGQ